MTSSKSTLSKRVTTSLVEILHPHVHTDHWVETLKSERFDIWLENGVLLQKGKGLLPTEWPLLADFVEHTWDLALQTGPACLVPHEEPAPQSNITSDRAPLHGARVTTDKLPADLEIWVLKGRN